MSARSERAIEKLRQLMGPEAAAVLVREKMLAVGVTSLDDPSDLATFADELIRAGGIIEAVGRAIKIQALLAGGIPRASGR